MRPWLTALIVFVCATLCACAGLQRTLEPEPIFPKPTVAIDVGSLPKGQAGLCDKNPRVDGTIIPSEVTRFSIAMNCAYQLDPSDTDFQYWMTRFIDNGIALSNQTCETHFDQLESRRVDAAYSQTNVNIGGTAVTAILAATNAHARAILNLATSLTLANAWFENYKANYILTPQLYKLYSKIQENLRNPIGAQILTKSKANGYRSFDEAKQDVMKYDKLCSHKVIQDIVTESIAKADLQPFTIQASPEKLTKATFARQELYEIAASGAAGDFANGEFEDLYVLATTTPDSDRIAMAQALTDTATGLAPKLASYVTKLGLDAVNPVTGVIANFRYIGEVFQLDSSSDVAVIRMTLKAKVAAAKTWAGNPLGAPVSIDPAHIQAERNAFRSLVRPTDSTRVTSSINFGYEVRDNRELLSSGRTPR